MEENNILESLAINNIVIKGAKEHNLKNIDVTIPKNKLVVITGLSGSGKSSLAFDTIYAEGQRRYVESLSSYARQFLGIMQKPKVDKILGLSPSISIDQKTKNNNPRSTVGTVTEIYDYIRLLYASIGIPHCPICGRPVQKQSIDEIVNKIVKEEKLNTKLQILSPIVRGEKGTHEKILDKIASNGFVRVNIDDVVYDLSFDEIKLEKNKKHNIDIIVDRLILKDDSRSRLTESIQMAMDYANGLVKIDNLSEVKIYSSNYSCPEHNISFEEISPRLFSFNNPFGACEDCNGLGRLLKIDKKLIIPDKEKTLYNGIKAFGATTMKKGDTMAKIYFESIGKHYGINIENKKIKDLPREFLDKILYGTGDEEILFKYNANGRKIEQKKTFEGVIPTLERRHRETTSEAARKFIELYMSSLPCDKCKGTRLKEKVLNVFVGDLNISELTNLSIVEMKKYLENLEFSEEEMIISKEILKEIISRTTFLIDVGLGYLTLSREASTLSGGESQRIRLATQIGSYLTGVTYILDEPSIGLHQRDNEKLINTLLKLRDIGNSVIVVEHDEDTMIAADKIIDIGPCAGVHGGYVVAEGNLDEIKKSKNSITGKYLSGKEKILIPKNRRKGNGKYIELKNVHHNNLANVNVKFPLGKFITITGVSGSGKSSLISDVLYQALKNRIYKSNEREGKYDEILGVENIDKVINIDQSPIGRTPRSNPATYTGIFDNIREIFANTNEAKLKGYSAGRFSFNVKGGRCEACQGDGVKRVEMYLLPDVFVTCDVCNGKRYNNETLDVKYKNKNIYEVLEMTVDEALEFFENIPKLKDKLQVLHDVGLGYIKLGQNAVTLSGGEAQRMKLAKELSKISTGKTVYVLDEPTTGLHIDDIKKLIDILNKITDLGNTVIVIEHNLDLIKVADYLIDLGPEGGEAGGNIIFEGTPEEIVKCKQSYTGKFIKDKLKKEDYEK